MRTLWDLIDPLISKLVAPSKPPATRKAKPVAPSRRARPSQPTASDRSQATHVSVAPSSAVSASPRTRRRQPESASENADGSMQAKYDAVVELMLRTHNIRVRKWRKSMSGIAWYVIYRDGKRVNLIEAPRPRGPMSAAVFLHEIGHHAIGFNVYKPRCLEEYHAWRWSLEAMAAHNLNITDAVRLRMHRSLHYAVQKAARRGIKRVPEELIPFMERPPRRQRRSPN